MDKTSASKVGIILFWHAVDIIFYGIALKFLAEWFVTPTFHTAKIGWAAAFGLVIVVRLLINRHGDDDRAITLHNLFVEALIPFLFVDAGYAVHHFLGGL